MSTVWCDTYYRLTCAKKASQIGAVQLSVLAFSRLEGSVNTLSPKESPRLAKIQEFEVTECEENGRAARAPPSPHPVLHPSSARVLPLHR